MRIHLSSKTSTFRLPNDDSNEPNLASVYEPTNFIDSNKILVFGYGIEDNTCQSTAGLKFFAKLLSEEYGVMVVTFDYRGVGKEDKFQTTSLISRYHDMISVTQHVREIYPNRKLTICGHGAGGSITARIGGHKHLSDLYDSVILSAPNAFNSLLWDEYFGEHLKETFDKHRCWEDSLEFPHFHLCAKPKALISIKRDDVVSPKITERYAQSCGEGHGLLKELQTFPAGHNVFAFQRKAKGLASIIAEILDSDMFQ